MTALAAVAVALAVWLLVAPARRPTRWADEPRQGTERARRSRWVWAAAGLAGSVMVGFVAAGHRGAVVASVLGILGATVAQVWFHHRRQLRARKARRDVTQACATLASVVAAGRVPAEALREVADDWPVLSEGAVTAALGGDPTVGWRVAGQLPGQAGLQELARGWSVAQRTGAPLVAMLDQIAEAQRADADLRHTVEAELASSRATGRLLAALPLMGLGLGFAFGGNPLSFLLDHPVGWCCLIGGAGLASVGTLWNERIADKAEGW